MIVKTPAVLFLAATEMEAEGILAARPFAKQAIHSFVLYTSEPNDLACLVTGPGVFNTAAGLSLCLSEMRPGLVVDIGIAGAYPDTGLAIGDLAVADQETYAHTGVGQNQPLPFDLIPDLKSTRRGMYPLDRGVSDRCKAVLDAQGLGPVPSGPFLTVSRLTDSKERARGISADDLYLMESMEGASAAHVCTLFNLPMAEVRAASNIAGERDKDLWDIPRACERLTEAGLALIEDLADR